MFERLGFPKWTSLLNDENSISVRGKLIVPKGAEVIHAKQEKKPSTSLLSALQYLKKLPDGQTIFQQMIKEEDNRFIVRLIHDDGDQAFFFAIPKPIKGPFSAEDELMQHLIQIAYYALKGKSRDPIYKCLTTLTGFRNENRCSLPLQQRKNFSEVNYVLNPFGIYTFIELMRVHQQTMPKEIKNEICHQVFADDTKLFSMWCNWMSEVAPQWKNIVMGQRIYQEVLEAFQQTDALGMDVVFQTVNQWIAKGKILPSCARSRTR